MSNEKKSHGDKSQLLPILAKKYDLTPDSFFNAVKKIIVPNNTNVSNQELIVFFSLMKKYDINPFARQATLIKTKSGMLVPILMIDGWLEILNRQSEYDGMQVDFIEDKEGRLYACEVSIFRKDRKHPTKFRELFSECNVPSSSAWKQMPYRMLRHKAIIQCIRATFSISGIYDADEAEKIDLMTANKVTVEPDKDIVHSATVVNPFDNDLNEVPLEQSNDQTLNHLSQDSNEQQEMV